ncbi:MAG: AAA family ATPase [Proteobacteria bacterium]|nr:AAA family ATPase [Pseudomonadota bacterium]
MTMANNYKEFQVNKLFGIDPSRCPDTMTFRGFEQKRTHVPDVNPDYVFSPSYISDLGAWWLIGGSDALAVVGDTGCGKTSFLNQFFARLNVPVYEINGHARMEVPELIGSVGIKNGNTVFEYGPLAMAYKFGGIFLLNEFDLLDAGTLTGLNAIRDLNPLTIPENNGEVIFPHIDFRFVVTANTNGSGDASQGAVYHGTNRMNMAFMDAFYMFKMGYPSAEVEMAILDKVVPMLPKAVVGQMINVARSVRRAFAGMATPGGEVITIESTFSTRTLIRWAKYSNFFRTLGGAKEIDPLTGEEKTIVPVIRALERVLSNKIDPASAEAIIQMVKAEGLTQPQKAQTPAN